MSHHHPTHYKEQWWKEAWRPAAAAVYLIICLLDFGIMPLIYEWMNASLSNNTLVELALRFVDSAAQIEALHTLKQSRVWVPLTLQGNGMFHIAFGAILGVAAFTRGQEKVAWASVGLQPGGYTPVGYTPGYSQPGGYGNQAFNGMGGMGGMNSFNGMQQSYGNAGYGNPAPQQYNAHPAANPVKKPATPKPAVDAGPSMDVVNPDDDNNE